MSTEEFKVSGNDVISTIKRIIAEGNARRIMIKNEAGDTIVEFPLTLGAVGALLAPLLAAVGAVTALVTKCTIVVERRDTPASAPAQEQAQEPPKSVEGIL